MSGCWYLAGVAFRAVCAASLLLWLSPPQNCVAQAPESAAVDSSQSVPAVAADEVLAKARHSLKAAEYDEAIGLLREAIPNLQGDRETLREAYLLLIKTFVTRGNSVRLEPQGRVTSELYYGEAEKTIEECLSIEELRHMTPDPLLDPPEMIRLVEEVRGRIFGSFRVVKLEPPSALVYLDGRRLFSPEGSAFPGESDIPVGPHKVEVKAEGFRDLTETIQISPNASLERPFTLQKGRGVLWWTTRGALAVAGGVGLALVINRDGGSTTLPILPEPPARPGS
jgi:HAMP domain-containing protein